MTRVHLFVPALALTLSFACSSSSNSNESNSDAGRTGNDAGSISGADGGSQPDAGNLADGGSETMDGGSETMDGGSETTDGGTTGPWPPPKYTTFNKSGTRLTANALLDEEGNSVVAWFTDTQLGKRCTIQRANDGTSRCLPEATSVSSGISTGVGGYFADGSCTQPLLRVPAACTQSKYYSLVQTTGTSIYERKGTPAAIYVGGVDRNNNPTCTAGTAPAGEALVIYEEKAPSTFVGFTSKGVGEGASVRVNVLEGDDGSSVAAGLWDVARAQPAKLVDNHYVIPFAHSRHVTELVYATCNGGSAYVDAAVTPTPAYFEFVTQTRQGQRIVIYRAVTGTQTTYCQNGQTMTASPGYLVYVLDNNAVQATTFPAVEVRVDERAGQRFAHVTTTEGEPLVPSPPGLGAVSVRVDGGWVTPMIYDGKLSRIAGPYTGVSLYGDSACTKPVVEAPTATDTVVFQTAGSYTASCDVLPGTGEVIEKVWIASGSGGISRMTYFWDGGSCLEAGPMQSRFASDATAQVATLVPPLKSGAP
jgi:hypothetical protein